MGSYSWKSPLASLVQSPSSTSGCAYVSPKQGGNGSYRTFGESPRIPSDWLMLGHVLNPEPIPMTRGKAYADWPMWVMCSTLNQVL